MDKTKAHDFAIQELGKGRQPDQVIYRLCEQFSLNWKEAQALVHEVQVHDQHEITRRQAPLLVTLALLIFISGFAALFHAAMLIIGIGQTALNSSLAEALMFRPNAPYIIAIELVTGLAMVTGSLMGMKGIWAAIFDWLERFF